MPNSKVQPFKVQSAEFCASFASHSDPLSVSSVVAPVNSVDFGNQNCTGSGGVRFPGPKNAVFACIGGLGTRFPGAVPNGSRGSQPVSMVQFFGLRRTVSFALRLNPLTHTSAGGNNCSTYADARLCVSIHPRHHDCAGLKI